MEEYITMTTQPNQMNPINMSFNAPVQNAVGQNEGGIHNYKPEQTPAQVQEIHKSRKILILAANPKATTPLRLDEEVREVVDEEVEESGG